MRAVRLKSPSLLTRRWAGLLVASLLSLSVLAGGALAADSRDFTVTVSNPSPASAGGATAFNVDVQSNDNQTIANVRLTVPSPSSEFTITDVFGADASLCAPTTGTSLSCDLGNLAAYGSRHISVVVDLASTVSAGNTVTFTATAETNNENGANQQVVSGTSGTLAVVPFDANSLTTFKLTGQAATSGVGGAGGKLQTIVKLLANNGGLGNSIAIVEGSSATQPAYCEALKLTCQPDFSTVTVNDGSPISPYLETTLVAQVPKKYNIKKAFVIHVLDNGQVEVLYNEASASCSAHPAPPCADFSLSEDDVLTITIRTATNGKFNF